MGVRDRNISTLAAVGQKLVDMQLGTSSTSQTGALAYAVTPGFPFRVTKVTVFAVGVTATITVDVQIGGVSVLSAVVTPTAGTEVAGTLTTTNANQTGGSTDQLQLKYTSNGTGAATGLTANVWIKPLGMEGDPKTKG